MNIKFFIYLLIICTFCLNIFGQVKVRHQPHIPINKTSTPKFLPLSEVKEGMRGNAETVFSGTKPEPFNVEILGVVPNAVGPKQDMIVCRISGGQADRTQVFAGMSGSPVYIDGKLVGAIAYAFPFSKEAICGITPIEQMISIFEKNRNVAKNIQKPRAISVSEFYGNSLQPNIPNELTISNSVLSGTNSNLQSVAGQTFQPISTPIIFNGFNQATLDKFAPQLKSFGLLPVATVGGDSKITPLKKADKNTLRGGDSVVMQLVRGDYSLSAAGTVTLRDGDKIYAFGHPFLNLGASDLPMTESHVVTVVPNLNNSFKLTVADALVGSMTQDRATGVFGKLGKAPKMIPVKLNLKTSRNQRKTFNFEVAKNDALTSLLIYISVYNSIIANERTMGKMSTSISGEIKIKGQDAIKINSRATGTSASQLVARAASNPVNILLNSNFEGTEIQNVNLNLNTGKEIRTATLESIGVNKAEIKAGEEIEVHAYIREDSGRVFIEKIPVKIPADTPSGMLTITISDGRTLQFLSASRRFVPKNLTELIKIINGIKKSDRLYVQTRRVTKGAIIGATEMPNLPPSMLGTLNNTRKSNDFKSTTQTVLTEKALPATDFIVSGQKTIAVKVIK